MSQRDLSHIENDVLQEIGNIVAGNDTTSMANLMNQEVNMKLPYVHLVTINEMMDIFGGPEEILVTTFFKVNGDITGTVYFLLSIEEASFIARQMLQDKSIQITTLDELDDMVESVLKEVANIVVGAYISALADFANINVHTTVPFLSIDIAAETLVTGLIEISNGTDKDILIVTQFSETQQHYIGNVLRIYYQI